MFPVYIIATDKGEISIYYTDEQKKAAVEALKTRPQSEVDSFYVYAYKEKYTNR